MEVEDIVGAGASPGRDGERDFRMKGFPKRGILCAVTDDAYRPVIDDASPCGQD